MTTETPTPETTEPAATLEVPPAPQIILDAHMLRSWYRPADPAAALALLPPALRALDPRQVFLNQYVVESEDQTSGVGPYELGYVGLTVQDHDVGGFPAHWLFSYLNSSPVMRAYAAGHDFPVGEGRTHVTRDGDIVTATTLVDGEPLIRTVARAGDRTAIMRGQVGYIYGRDRLTLGRAPFVAEVADPLEVRSIEFLDPSHPVYALRPAEPLQIDAALYCTRISFAYWGGETSL
jgi:hypothetical protein